MASCLVLFFLILLAFATGYYVTPNHLTWEQSVEYCQSYCDSNLASIHNISQNNDMIDTIKSAHLLVDDTAAEDVFFGLYDDTTKTNYKWMDGTSYSENEFGGSNSFYSFPWATNMPDSQINVNCGQIWIDSPGGGYGWDDTGCSSERRALCNTCSGKLNKYIILKENNGMNYANAETECNTQIGTNLASMHSQRDFQELQALCQLFDIDHAVIETDDCWIGLNDIDSTGTWVWKDGTTFDYGSTLKQYPWYSSRPDQDSSHGVALGQYTEYYLDDFSTGEYAYPICNIPSELCVANFYNIYGNQQSFIFDDTNCNAQSYDSSRNEAFIMNKVYMNHDEIVLIDYIYKIDNQSNNSRAGIAIPTDTCSAYYVGIYVDDTSGNIRLFLKHIEYNGDNTDYDSSSLIDVDYSIQFDNNIYYLLSVTIERVSGTNRIKFTMSINDGQGMTNENEKDFDLSSISVGIWSENTIMEAKSLYISGTPINSTNGIVPDIGSCSPQYTNKPTSNPSAFPTLTSTNTPTKLPTISPTFKPTNYGVIIKYGIVITVTFDYKFTVNDTNTIKQVIQDITTKLINDTLTANCVESDDLNIHSRQEGNITIINATIFVCNKDSQTLLLKAFVSNNITADIVNDIHQQTGLQISIGSTSLQTDTIIIYKQANNDIDDTSTTLNIRFGGDDDGENNGRNTRTALGIIFGFLLFVVCALSAVYIYRQKRNKTKYSMEYGEGEEGAELQRVVSKSMNSTYTTNVVENNDEYDGYKSREPGQTIDNNITDNNLTGNNVKKKHKKTSDDIYGPGIDRVGSNVTDRGFGDSVFAYNANASSLPNTPMDEDEQDRTFSKGDDINNDDESGLDRINRIGSNVASHAGSSIVLSEDGNTKRENSPIDYDGDEDEKMYEPEPDYTRKETPHSPTPLQTPQNNMVMLPNHNPNDIDGDV